MGELGLGFGFGFIVAIFIVVIALDVFRYSETSLDDAKKLKGTECIVETIELNYEDEVYVDMNVTCKGDE